MGEAAVVRPVHVYKVPLKSGAGVVSSIGVVELTGEEELLAEKRAKGDRSRVAVELSKQALVEVDGKPVSLADGTADEAWNKMPAKVRTLVVTAYSRLHVPDDEDTNAFFESMEVRV